MSVVPFRLVCLRFSPRRIAFPDPSAVQVSLVTAGVRLGLGGWNGVCRLALLKMVQLQHRHCNNEDYRRSDAATTCWIFLCSRPLIEAHHLCCAECPRKNVNILSKVIGFVCRNT